MLDILIYSYLLLPLCFIITKAKIKDGILVELAAYGVIFFCLLFFYDYARPIKFYYHAVYTFLEYAAFTFIFWYNIQSKIFRKLIVIVSILFLLFQLYYVSDSKVQKIDSIPIGIETILVFIYIFFFFFDFSRSAKDTFIYTHYCFWISVGILIYLGGSFFYYILANNLDKQEIQTFNQLTYIAELIKNLLIGIAFFLYKKFPANNLNNHTPKKIPNLDMI